MPTLANAHIAHARYSLVQARLYARSIAIVATPKITMLGIKNK